MNKLVDLLENIQSLLEMALSGANEEEILAQALEYMSEITSSSGAYFHTFDEHESAIELVAWSKAVHEYCDVKASSHYPLEEAGIWADSVRLRKAVIHNDYANLPREEKKGLPEGHFTIDRHMSVPVFSQHKVVSIAGVANKAIHYTDEDAKNVETLCEMAWLVIEQKKAQRIMKEYAFEDGLTGIANRRRFDTSLKEEWNRHRRNGSSLGVVMFDIDLFKNVNDVLGHDAGDQCLKRIGQALHSAFRRAGELVSRYGGEEFILILPESTNEQCAMRAEFGRKVVEDLKIIHPSSPVSEFVTVSAGYACQIPSDEDCLSLVKQADENLYKAKSAGRNCVKG